MISVIPTNYDASSRVVQLPNDRLSTVTVVHEVWLLLLGMGAKVASAIGHVWIPDTGTIVIVVRRVMCSNSRRRVLGVDLWMLLVASAVLVIQRPVEKARTPGTHVVRSIQTRIRSGWRCELRGRV